MDREAERRLLADQFWTNIDSLWDERWEQVWAFFNAENKTVVPLLWEAIRRIPGMIGRVIEEHDAKDGRLIVILRSSPANAEQQIAAGKILRALIDTRCISFIPSAAAKGEYDFSPFSSIPEPDIRAKTLDHFMRTLVVGPASYACIMAARGSSVEIIGVEDVDLYVKAHEARKQGPFGRAADGEGFHSINVKRCRAIAENTVGLLKKRGEGVAAQDLEYLACMNVTATYKELGVSFVVIEPFTASDDDMDLYEKALRGESDPMMNMLKGLLGGSSQSS